MNLESVKWYLDWVAWVGGLWAAWAFLRVALQRGADRGAEWFADLRVQYEARRQLSRHATRAAYEAEATAKSAVDFGPDDEEDAGLAPDPGFPQDEQGQARRVVFKRRPERPPPQPDAVEPQVRAARPSTIPVEGAPLPQEKKAVVG